jgi:3-methyladenine DNA glycosylase AlkD
MKLTNVIEKELKNLADANVADHSLRFFKTGKGQYGEGDQFLGIRVPVLRKVARKYQTVSPAQAADLLQSPYHEQRLLALILMVDLFNQAHGKDRETIYHLYMANTRHINSWDLLDTSAPHIPGAHLKDRDKKELYDFSRSGSLWERRIAIVATFHFIRENDFADALGIAAILLNDGEDLIHKAVGWMLREIGKRDRAVEETFLETYHKTMPRTMLRYAIEQFPDTLRRQYLQIKTEKRLKHL